MESWSQVLVQIPIVAAFIWYTLERDRRDSDARSKRDEQWQCFLTVQQNSWQEFIASQSTVTLAALADVSRELVVVAERLDQLHGIITHHDGAMREAIQQMRMAKRNGK